MQAAAHKILAAYNFFRTRVAVEKRLTGLTEAQLLLRLAQGLLRALFQGPSLPLWQ
jgi:hypothetical protein